MLRPIIPILQTRHGDPPTPKGYGGTSLRVAIQKKALLEGWVMNGKVGNLSNRDMNVLPPREKIEFYRSGALLKSYDVSEVYKTYAKSILRGLNKYMGCVP